MGYNNKSITVYKDRYAIIRGKIYYYPDKDSEGYERFYLYLDNVTTPNKTYAKRLIIDYTNKDQKTVIMKLIAKPTKTLALLNINNCSFSISHIAKAILTNNYYLGEVA
jgi:hypothetical protein